MYRFLNIYISDRILASKTDKFTEVLITDFMGEGSLKFPSVVGCKLTFITGLIFEGSGREPSVYPVNFPDDTLVYGKSIFSSFSW